jgi:ABC-type multidrug transport system fused ATPase/permease subunit
MGVLALIAKVKRLLSVEWRTVAWVFRLMLARRWLFVALTAAVLGSALMEGTGIAILVPLLDAMNRSANAFASIPLMSAVANVFSGWSAAEELQLIAALLAIFALFRSGFAYLTGFLTQLFALQIERQLKVRMIRSTHALDFERLQAFGPTTLLGYAVNMTVQTGYFASLMATAGASLVMLMLYLTVCLMLSWQLTLLAAVALLLAVQFVRMPLVGRLVESGKQRVTAVLAMNNVIFAALSGAKLVRLVGGEEHDIARVSEKIDAYIANERWYSQLQSLVDPMFQASATFVIAVLLYSSAIILGGHTTDYIPLILLFLFVLSRIINPVQTLNRARLGLAAVLEGVQTLFYYLEDAQQNQEADGWLQAPALAREIALERVSFTYRTTPARALDDISFEIPAHRITALVGPSGSGKSTVVGLLTRLYRPKAGRITIDGTDIATLKLTEWRSRIAVVSQDTFLFDDTIEANLRLARPHATDAEIKAAAQLAGAHDFIAELPEGYNTVVGDRGTRLSGGQQQRLAIARALLAAPMLLLLDEATSNLDADSEYLVSKTLDAIADRTTVLVIAHRLATVQRADRIIVLDSGRVVETGTHRSLMEAKGRYHGMVMRQMFLTDSPAANDLVS